MIYEEHFIDDVEYARNYLHGMMQCGKELRFMD